MKMRLPTTMLVTMLTATAALAQTPGERIRIDPAALPAPGATPSTANPSEIDVRPAASSITVPPGFEANIFAKGFTNARWLQVAPNGDVFLADSGPGRIVVLRDADGDGVAETRSTFISI
jgi:glucose/arabinose dehydrogenase